MLPGFRRVHRLCGSAIARHASAQPPWSSSAETRLPGKSPSSFTSSFPFSFILPDFDSVNIRKYIIYMPTYSCIELYVHFLGMHMRMYMLGCVFVYIYMYISMCVYL